jgi:hypothetical protein
MVAGPTQFAQFNLSAAVRPSFSAPSSQVDSAPLRGLLSSGMQSTSGLPLQHASPFVSAASSLFTGPQSQPGIVKPAAAQPVSSSAAAQPASSSTAAGLKSVTQASVPFQFGVPAHVVQSSKQNVAPVAAPSTTVKLTGFPGKPLSAETTSAKTVNPGMSSADLQLTSNSSLSGSFNLGKPVSQSTPAPSGVKTTLPGLSLTGQPGRPPVISVPAASVQAETTKVAAGCVVASNPTLSK